ncbi:uncharacterized protein LOC123513467 [Portunus trituberculatus]|uniref:uncharacterized protein LOC123513467 n=1 Tax=Portunus trituberculatus TaxID=210409 RepID=UPI001E1CC691|nr:uncharacterized protein LOC123513467 [Portunus trituberculatus]
MLSCCPLLLVQPGTGKLPWHQQHRKACQDNSAECVLRCMLSCCPLLLVQPGTGKLPWHQQHRKACQDNSECVEVHAVLLSSPTGAAWHRTAPLAPTQDGLPGQHSGKLPWHQQHRKACQDNSAECVLRCMLSCCPLLLVQPGTGKLPWHQQHRKACQDNSAECVLRCMLSCCPLLLVQPGTGRPPQHQCYTKVWQECTVMDTAELRPRPVCLHRGHLTSCMFQ